MIGGRALQLAESDGVDLVSSTPGRVVVEISGPELWPLAFDLEYQPTGSMTLSWEGESFIANGQDLVKLNISLVGDGVNGEAIVQILDPRGVVTQERVRLEQGRTLFTLRSESAGTYEVEVKSPGALPVTASIFCYGSQSLGTSRSFRAQ